MTISVYAIRDSLLGFSMPVLRDNDAVASRAFEFDCNKDSTPYKSHPEHFQLYRIGSYDTDTGTMFSESPILISSAVDFVKE